MRGANECFDLLSSAGVWLRTEKALRSEPCSDRLFYACGNLGPFGNFSMSRWPRVNVELPYLFSSISAFSGASRMRAGQGICVLRQGILGHFRPLLDIFGAKGLFKDTFLFEGRGCIPILASQCLPCR